MPSPYKFPRGNILLPFLTAGGRLYVRWINGESALGLRREPVSSGRQRNVKEIKGFHAPTSFISFSLLPNIQRVYV